MKSEYSEENNAIPPEFGKDPETVLLLKFVGSGRDRFLKKAAKRNYDGPYEIVESGVSANKKFPDKEKYRYIIEHEMGTGYTITNASGRSTSGAFKRYYVYDRLEDKKYSSGAEFTFYAKGLRVYLDALNKKRNSFGHGQD